MTLESPATTGANLAAFDVEKIRADFPILHQQVHGKPLVYLDNAATTQKPQAVIDAIVHHLTRDNANIHRGVHALSQRATAAFDAVREKVKTFVNARDERDIVFVRGVTEAVNLVANTWGRANLKAGDEIILSGMEHHADIVPWQMVAAQTGAIIKVIPFDERGQLRLDEYEKLLGERTKFVGIVHVSNALGTINPVAESLPPFMGGGDMIASVKWEGTTYASPPGRFEAGTPNIEGVIGFGAAIDYVTALGIENIAAYEQRLLAAVTARMEQMPAVRIVGTAANKSSVISFVMEGAHPHDIGAILDQEGVAIRAGHHCAEPLMRAMNLTATARASFTFYNTLAEVEAFVRGLETVRKIFG